MAVNKTDPRVVKTRNSLRKALVYLMRREKIEDMSVQKITETASITRGTFYLHYKDKHDFIKSAIKEILDDFFAEVMVDSDDFSLSMKRTVQVFSVSRAFNYIEKNADIFDVLLNSEKTDFFYEQMYDRLANGLVNYCNTVNDPQKQQPVPLQLQISFIDSAFLGLIRHWLKDGMIYTARYMTQSVEKMFNQFNSDNIISAGFFVSEEGAPVSDI
ncbi:TetR/AcrR family transcriptional regulator [Limosilactobacillus oris]|uniref:TetR/AcrR family transcriptional regulator n=1 Tax=Limosilactobacillus oris TaxID=1632 RepID=UPI0024B3BF58|nr:TetR/AcrR family transcriptional regulator [Limosilactobacillus oris]WHO84876.1 TetR-like C-terminal domain-containing protein [Limosilactobacillus oris]